MAEREIVPKGAIILHEDIIGTPSYGPIPLSYDILAHPEFIRGVALATRPLCLYSKCCTVGDTASKLLSGSFNNVEFVHLGSNDFKHDHDGVDGGLGTFLDVLELSRRCMLPVYYYNNRTGNITQVTIVNSLAGLQILSVCDSDAACNAVLEKYFSEIRSKEPERKAQVAAEP